MKKNFSNNLPYIIGETSFNHQGDIDYLKKMIDEIADIGLDAVKFHLGINPKSRIQKNHPNLKNAIKMNFKADQWDNIFSYTKRKNIDIIALCNDVESIHYAIHKNVDAIEIHSTGLNDYFLLTESSKFKGLIILGIGGSSIEEIDYAVDFLRERDKKDIILMYGFQNYPTDYNNINISKMNKLHEMYKLPIGYADHTAYDDPNMEFISVMAAVLGFNILEKHYTLNFGEERIDFEAAAGKKQMGDIKKLLNLVLKVRGDGSLEMSNPEIEYGKTGPMKKAIVARKKIMKGEILSIDNLWFKRTREETNIKQNQFMNLLGCKAIKDIEEDEIINHNNVNIK